MKRSSSLSAFFWRTGEPSCLYTEAGERAARRMAAAGKALDKQGRATVGMGPRTTGGISLAKPGDADKTQRIKRGTSS